MYYIDAFNTVCNAWIVMYGLDARLVTKYDWCSDCQWLVPGTAEGLLDD